MNLLEFYRAVTKTRCEFNDKDVARLYVRDRETVRKDIAVFIEFPDGDPENDGVLKTSIKKCGQHANWYAAEKLKAHRADGAVLYIRYLMARAYAHQMPLDYRFTGAEANDVRAAANQLLRTYDRIELLTGGAVLPDSLKQKG